MQLTSFDSGIHFVADWLIRDPQLRLYAMEKDYLA